MPIKPENAVRYPANWKTEIRPAILARAGNRCEQCAAENGRVIVRGKGRHAGTYMIDTAEVFDAETGEALGRVRMSDYETDGKGVTVVLTIAHLDHTPENCDHANLRAWCQRCHLAYDAEHHARNSAKTRRDRKAIADLFDDGVEASDSGILSGANRTTSGAIGQP